MPGDYQLVKLRNGAQTLFSARYGEKMHPGLGPQAEAEALYVHQLKLRERLQNHAGEFVIWDVGLGAAANALTVLRATRDISGQLRLVSFDNTAEPLEFALQHAAELSYLAGYENQITELLREKSVEFTDKNLSVRWEFHLGDFPDLLHSQFGNRNSKLPPPHVIMFDAFSPAKNPAMWTLPLFINLFQSLDPQRHCVLPTYSRSTMIRATLLLAGFFVGTGRATGLKEETTVAANTLGLIEEPLDRRWLERARRSHSAEPLVEAVYSRTPLSPATVERLLRNPQFANYQTIHG
jgi:tRNA U34 5-methylaminomethyl-2-thiouridine-forming methyltransferase MnmC